MSSRRQFLAAAAGSLAALGLQPRSAQPRPLIKPPRLKPGDRIGLVNPATAAFESMPIEILTESFEALGLEVVQGPSYFDRRGYFAGKDKDRAADINAFFADPEISGLVARGGWGSARVLPHLDYEVIARHPKVVLGYSDVTALLLAIHARSGLVTFHGPYPRTHFSAEHLRRVLFDAEALLMWNPREVANGQTVQTEGRIQTITPGKARGRLLGGNLTVLTTIVGSSYLPDWRDCILFVEDLNEAIYRVDRMFTQLALAGILDQIAGFIFGHCTDCPPGTNYGSLTLEEVLQDHIAPLGVPAWRGAMIGHIDKQFTIPLGIEAEIDADEGTIRLLEPAVV